MMNTAATSQAPLDWSRTSRDYLEHRPGYPNRFFDVLQALGVGLPGQEVLDFGAGTGAFVPVASRGARVVAVDSADAQLQAAITQASRQGTTIGASLAKAEETSMLSTPHC